MAALSKRYQPGHNALKGSMNLPSHVGFSGTKPRGFPWSGFGHLKMSPTHFPL